MIHTTWILILVIRCISHGTTQSTSTQFVAPTFLNPNPKSPKSPKSNPVPPNSTIPIVHSSIAIPHRRTQTTQTTQTTHEPFVLQTTLTGHTTIVYSVAYSPDGSLIVSGDGNGHIHLWEPNTPTLFQTTIAHTSTVSSLAFFPNGTRMVSASWDKTIKLWDVVVEKVPSSDYHSYDSGVIRRTTLRLRQTLEGHMGSIYTVAINRDGTRIASGDRAGYITIWKKMGADGDDDDTWLPLTLREQDPNQPQQEPQKGYAHDRAVSSVAFNHNSSRLVSSSWDGTIKLWNIQDAFHNHSTIVLLHTMVQEGRITSMAYTNDGSRIASGDRNGVITVWDVNNGCVRLYTLEEGHGNSVVTLGYNHDGSGLVSGSLDNTVKIWDMEDDDERGGGGGGGGTLLQTLTIDHNYITSVVFNNDGSRIAVGSYDKTVQVWKRKCSEGTYLLDGKCRMCPKGTIQALSDQTSCHKCPHIYKPNKNHTDCIVSENRIETLIQGMIVVVLILIVLLTKHRCNKGSNRSRGCCVHARCLDSFGRNDTLCTNDFEQEMTPVLGNV